MDLIEGSESKEYYQKLYEHFKHFRNDPQLRIAVLSGDPAMSSQRQKLFDYLNYYELVAVSIEMGIIDETFYRKWMQFAFVRDWNESPSLITEARTVQGKSSQPDKKAYESFETLAIKWGGQPLSAPGTPHWWARPPR